MTWEALTLIFSCFGLMALVIMFNTRTQVFIRQDVQPNTRFRILPRALYRTRSLIHRACRRKSWSWMMRRNGQAVHFAHGNKLQPFLSVPGRLLRILILTWFFLETNDHCTETHGGMFHKLPNHGNAGWRAR